MDKQEMVYGPRATQREWMRRVVYECGNRRKQREGRGSGGGEGKWGGIGGWWEGDARCYRTFFHKYILVHEWSLLYIPRC